MDSVYCLALTQSRAGSGPLNGLLCYCYIAMSRVWCHSSHSI